MMQAISFDILSLAYTPLYVNILTLPSANPTDASPFKGFKAIDKIAKAESTAD